MLVPPLDRELLMSELMKLNYHQQVAFGVACCERILSNYERFRQDAGWGTLRPLRHMLDILWKTWNDGEVPSDELRRLSQECEDSAPSSENFDSLYVTAAQDAVFAACSVVDFVLTREIEALMRARQYPMDSLDLLIQEQENMDPSDARLEEKILMHPLMQQEIRRQMRDLDDLRSMERYDEIAFARFRARAQTEEVLSLTIFDFS